MNTIWTELLIVLGLVLLNGVFAMSEIAVVSARRVRLQQRADEGDRGAQTALELAADPGQFLSTVQIGITLIGIVAGVFGGATLASQIAVAIGRWELLAPYSELIGALLVVLLISYLSLVVGELVPKRIGLGNAEKVAARVAPMMRRLSRLTAPAVWVLTRSTELILRLLGVTAADAAPLTETEIRMVIAEGAESGVVEPKEQQIMERVFRFGDRPATALMTPRPDVIWLDLEQSPAEIQAVLTESGHSRFPVAEGELDELRGVAYAKDLLAQVLSGRPIDLHSVLQPALYVPETMPGIEVLEKFRAAHSHMALVIDEYGGFQGVVTLYDILEALVGDIPTSEQPHDQDAVRRDDGSWLVDGSFLVDELKELLDLGELPYEDEGYYQTLGGMVMSALGRIPAVGDVFAWKDWRFEVVDMDGRRVDRVLITPANGES